MPYKVEKHDQGYFVVNQETGKKYSKKPLTKAKANSQLKALYANTAEGAGLGDFLVKAFKKTKNLASSIATNVKDRIVGTVVGRNDYPPADRSLIERYGDKKITGICIYRDKVAGSVNTLVNVISLGQFNKVKNKYGYDDLYHLMMVITLEGGIPILLEKNEVINIHEYPTIKPSYQKFELSLPSNWNTTFKQFLSNGEAFMGDDYFKYDAMTNNCQRYIKSLVLANPPLQKENPDAIKFIEQDITGLQRDLSPTTQKIFRATTDLASRLNVLAKGKGFDGSNINHHYNENL
jgi:hypothetical protein